MTTADIVSSNTYTDKRDVEGALSSLLMHQSGLTTAVRGSAGRDWITVIVADDHGIVRSGLRALLEPHPRFHVVAEADDLSATLASVHAERPDIVLLDLDMRDGSTLPAIGRLRALSPGTRVVVLTMHADPELARRAIDAGAAAYILKEAAPRELVNALLTVFGGQRYLYPSLGARLVASREGDPLGALTAREREVFAAVVRGAKNKDIAARLHLSVRTVETHRARLQEKLGVSGLLELVNFARRHDLLT